MTATQIILVFIFFNFHLVSCKSSDTYSAVVVEYHPAENSSLNSTTKIEINVANYVSIIHTASSQYDADIVVFPESALTGFDKTLLLPDPADKVQLCNSTLNYDSILVALACASQNTSTYVVVNLVEQFYNTSLQNDVYFNTDIVLDPTGALIARYRKINLYGEGILEPSTDGELVYFDTDFGVRFGLLTCFDIIFKTPGVVLARDYNVSHFIFPTHWFSQMPFLTAIQEQYYWAYTLDVVLLASQYNNPSTGSTGSGIYLGRQGPLVYNMTSLVGTFLLHADVPKQYPYSGNRSSLVNLDTTKNQKAQLDNEDTISETNSVQMNEEIYLKLDYLDVYTTELIEPLGDIVMFTSTKVTTESFIERRICQNSLCCDFTLNITTSFSSAMSNTSRGDDYSQLYYRIAVFDGVKNYDGADTGGLQTCAIIPCANTSLSSCGRRADSTSAVPNTVSDFYQTEFTFQSITITGNISNTDSFVGPNVLLSGQVDNNFGELLTPDRFLFNETEINGIVFQTFKTLSPTRIVTASLYGRLFTRDGKPYTGATTGGASATWPCFDTSLVIGAFILLRQILTKTSNVCVH